MSTKDKIYVAFDGDKDIQYYNLLKAWNNNDNLNFSINDAHDINTARDTSSEEQIKRQLKERFQYSKSFILLLGESTRYLYKFVKWEIETALELELPIIVVNLNKKRIVDNDRCPSILKDSLTIHISYEMKIIEYAINNWPIVHYKYIKEETKSTFTYKNDVYIKLGL
jgi:hypothetical protein